MRNVAYAVRMLVPISMSWKVHTTGYSGNSAILSPAEGSEAKAANHLNAWVFCLRRLRIHEEFD